MSIQKVRFFVFVCFLLPSLSLGVLNDDIRQRLADIDKLVEGRKGPTKGKVVQLIAILKNPDSPVLLKERAVWAMGQLELRKKINVIIEAAQSKSLLVRSAALHALAHLRSRNALPVYVNIAKNDPVLSLRQQATVALGLVRWEKAIEPLVALSSDPKPEIQGAAALSMAATHSQKNDFSVVLKEMAGSENPYVKKRALKGLDVIQRNHKAVRSHLLSLDPDIRLFAALFFHYHGRPADVGFLKKRLNAESDDDVYYELKRSIQAIQKAIKRQKAKQP